MFCKNCGNQISDTATFCTNCGTKIERIQETRVPSQPVPPSSVSSVSSVPPVPPVMRPQVPPQPVPSQPVPPVMRPASPQQPQQPQQIPQPASPMMQPRQPSQPYGGTPGSIPSSHPRGQQMSVSSGDVISYGQYMVMMLLVSIPIVNLILLFKWGFGNEVNPNKKNFAKAMLTFMLIAFVLSLIYGMFIYRMIMSMGSYY